MRHWHYREISFRYIIFRGGLRVGLPLHIYSNLFSLGDFIMTKAKEKTASDEIISGGERHQFQAEVSRLLNIVANSLYSERRFFCAS